MVINTTQYWCGNRFGKGLIATGRTSYPLTDEMADMTLQVLGEVGMRFGDLAENISILSQAFSAGSRTSVLSPANRLSSSGQWEWLPVHAVSHVIRE